MITTEIARINAFPEHVQNKMFAYLSNEDLRQTALVCKRWAELSAVARAVLLGQNAGFLWKVSDQYMNDCYVYVARSSFLRMDVMSLNPLLRAAFMKAKTVVFNGRAVLSDQQKEMVQKNIEELLTVLAKDMSTASKEKLRDVFLKCWTSHKMNIMHAIFARTVQCQKQIANLAQDDPDINEIIFYARWIDNFCTSELGAAFFSFLLSEQGAERFVQMFLLQDQAWIHSYRRLHDQASESIGDAFHQFVFRDVYKNHEKLRTQRSDLALLQQRNSELKTYAERHMEIIEKLLQTLLQHNEKVIGEIFNLLQRHPEPFLVILESNFARCKEVIETKNGQLAGPFTLPFKPRGLFWEVVDSHGKVVAYFLGSLHATPPHLLDFNSRILKGFESADTLAVEVDITREEVSREMDMANQARRRQMLDQLSFEQQQKLYVLIKGMIPADGETFGQDALLRAIAALERSLRTGVNLVPGIDWKFVTLAKAKQIPIVDLESIALHAKAVSCELEMGAAYSVLAEMGQTTFVACINRCKEELRKRICEEATRDWEFGIVEGCVVQERTPEDRELMVQRNKEMGASVHRLIQDGKKPFCIAGMNHGIGKQSILDVLGEYGYRCNQIVVFEELFPGAIRRMCAKI